MAQKVQRRRTNSASAPSAGRTAGRATAAEALAILHPERVVAIGPRTLEVREYGYIEGLQLQRAAQPFLDGLFAIFSRAEGPPAAEEIADVMAEHIVIVQWMQAQSITPVSDDPSAFVAAVTENARWIGTLSENEGDLLTAVWWEVNKHFFTRRLQRRALALRAAARQASPSVSSASTTP